MKRWQKELKKYFEIEIGIPEITFEYFWHIYDKKVTKKQSLDFWRKMKHADRVLAVLGVKRYKNYSKGFQGRELVDPVRYLKNRRYDDEY